MSFSFPSRRTFTPAVPQDHQPSGETGPLIYFQTSVLITPVEFKKRHEFGVFGKNILFFFTLTINDHRPIGQMLIFREFL
jgi:hypothetical protein